MAVHILRNTKIYIDGIDLSGKMNEVGITFNVELKDKTTFGSSSRKRLSGLFDTEISGSGFYDASSQYSGDKVLWDDVGSTDQICTVISNGTALNNVAYAANKLSGSLNYNFNVGEMANWSFACYGVGSLVRQNTLEIGSISTSLSATPANLGAREPTQLMYATLHNIRGTTVGDQKIVVKIQSAASSGFGSYSTALKFTSISTGSHTAQWKSTQSSTAHSWYRASIASSSDSGGSITGVLTLGFK